LRSKNDYLLDEQMQRHPSDDLIQLAEQQLAGRGIGEGANRKYESLLGEFRREASFDSLALRRSISELKQPGGMFPLAPATIRGRMGAFFIKQQSKLLWWLLRALRLRDEVLAAASVLLERQERRQMELERRIENLESALRALERRSDGL
jgi:hypothetical protein